MYTQIKYLFIGAKGHRDQVKARSDPLFFSLADRNLFFKSLSEY